MSDVGSVARAICHRDSPSLNSDMCWHLETNKDEYRKLAAAAIQAYQDHLKEQGLTIVPIEPTEEMISAADMELGRAGIYKAMIAKGETQ